MGRYVVGKALRALLTLIFVTLAIFLLSRASGDPVSLLVPADATSDEIDAVRTSYGLDRPLVVQYLDFVGGVFHGDLGQSIKFSSSNVSLILNRLPNTVMLALAAMAVALVISIPAGVAAAYRPAGWADRFARGLALAGQSVPTFVVALLLVYLFAIHWQFFPGGNRSGFSSLVLPALTLAWFACAAITRITRSSMLDALSSTYVLAARSQGIPERVILSRYALRNAGTAILTMTALQFVLLANGAVVVESIFNWPGIGNLTVQAAFARDYPLLQALVVFTAAMTIGIGLLSDIAYQLIDRRVSHGHH